VNLAGGADSLTLANGTNSLTVTAVETVTGNSGADTVTLGSVMSAGSVNLGAGTDALILMDGTNSLTASGVEFITGGTGADTITFGAPINGASIDLGAGVDRLTLADGGNAVTVTAVETVVGGFGADAITAAGSVAVTASGGAGIDTLVGASGADQLTGGDGADILTGGAGIDRFIYTALSHSSAGAGDTISDFNATADILVFSGLLKGSFNFLGAAAFTSTGSTEARFDDTTKILYIDTLGDGSADMTITLTGVPIGNLDASDFIWI
jgi:Ca2+-binding RTX toxin-like protein